MKNRKPADATFRNINALKKRVTDAEDAHMSLVNWAMTVEARLEKMKVKLNPNSGKQRKHKNGK